MEGSETGGACWAGPCTEHPLDPMGAARPDPKRPTQNRNLVLVLVRPKPWLPTDLANARLFCRGVVHDAAAHLVLRCQVPSHSAKRLSLRPEWHGKGFFVVGPAERKHLRRGKRHEFLAVGSIPPNRHQTM